MVAIHLGHVGTRRVDVDLDTLLTTRLLVQSNSGGGKSWLLRRLAEQLFGKVPVVIIDPEGEFATLREKHGFVLVGKGGETPVDTRSAALVAHKLLELHASAVCDLYETKPSERHRWVRLFLDALIDAPKKLWGPLVVIVDEAHVFVPEKGAGESEASDAMIALATRGRKRGFCAVWATQRLAKLRKDAAAELQNALVGATFMDIDRDRAADILGIARGDRAAFADTIKLLKPGNFFAFGRAFFEAGTRVVVKRSPTVVQIGDVSTSHPKPGSAEHSAEPPPAPAKVRALLPQLADLPAEAEKKVAAEKELRAEIAELRRQLAAAVARVEVVKQVERVEVPVIDDRVAEKVAVAMDGAVSTIKSVESLFRDCRTLIAANAARLKAEQSDSQRAAAAFGRRVERTNAAIRERKPVIRNGSEPAVRTGPEQRILDALAWLESIGVDAPAKTAVAFLAGYTANTGGFNNPCGALRSKGLIEYPGSGTAQLTDAGRAAANHPAESLTSEALQQSVLDRLPGPEGRILRPLLSAYPDAMSSEDLAAASNYAPNTGGFNNPKGRLRTLGLIEYPSPGHVRARDILFLEGR